MTEFYHVCYHVFIIFYCLQAEEIRHEVSQCCVLVYGVTYCIQVVGMMLCRGRLVTYFLVLSHYLQKKRDWLDKVYPD